jgi:hypothetical protein
MQFERDRRLAPSDGQRLAERGVVDALVVDDRELWLVVARRGESIEDWLHGGTGWEVAPLRICRSLLGQGRLLVGHADPARDRLLSELEEGC